MKNFIKIVVFVFTVGVFSSTPAHAGVFKKLALTGAAAAAGNAYAKHKQKKQTERLKER